MFDVLEAYLISAIIVRNQGCVNNENSTRIQIEYAIAKPFLNPQKKKE